MNPSTGSDAFFTRRVLPLLRTATGAQLLLMAVGAATVLLYIAALPPAPAPVAVLPPAYTQRYAPLIPLFWGITAPLMLLGEVLRLRQTISKGDLAAYLCLSVGIFAVYTGLWAPLLLPFLGIGLILNGVRQHRLGVKPWPRGALWPVAAVLLWVGYDFLSLSWSPDPQAGRHFLLLQVWIVPIVVVALAYPLPRRVLRLLMQALLRWGMLYVLLLLFLYLGACALIPCPTDVCFTTDKLYFPGPLGKLSPHFLLKLYPRGYDHYTFLGVLISLPLFYQLPTWVRSAPAGRTAMHLAVQALLPTLALLGYSFVMQGRLVMILCVLLLITQLLLLVRTLLPARHRRAYGVIVLLGFLLAGGGALYRTRAYLFQGDRATIQRRALEHLQQEDALMSGMGYGTSGAFVHSLGLDKKHLHNQFEETLYSAGLPALLLFMLFLLSLLYTGLTRRARPGLLLLLPLFLLMWVDLVFYVTPYMLGLWLPTLLALFPAPKSDSVAFSTLPNSSF